MSNKRRPRPDITLLLDANGIVLQATTCDELANQGVDAWIGRPWAETAGIEMDAKLRSMIDDARTHGVAAFREINQRFPAGVEMAIEYTVVRLGGSEGLMVVGRSLRAIADLQSRLIEAQQAMEQDYWKLREVETRYRLLFDLSGEAVLMARVDDLRVVDANPAAIRLLGIGRGRDFLNELAPHERDPFQTLLVRVREQGRAPGMVIHLGPERAPMTVRASLITSESVTVFLLQMSSGGVAAAAEEGMVSVDDLIDRMPDGFVVTDAEGIIRRANQGFLDLVQIGAENAVLGSRLGRWLSQPGADHGVLMANLQRIGVVRRFSTTLHGELGTEALVEVSAARGGDPKASLVGVMIRDVGRRLNPADSIVGLRSALSFITEQTGKTALPKLVRETVGIVERHCIEAALQLSDGNRTAAAELLGLSRQSLYEKLSRYDLEGSHRAGSELGLLPSH